MNVIERSKIFVGNRAIRSGTKSLKRNISSCNIQEAKSLGILFNATHMVSFEIVKGLVKNLSKENKNIMVLGFVNSKQLIDHYLYRKGFEFFTKKQLNWFHKPEGENIDAFINTPFDILLNLSLEETYPTKYIMALSKAKFKVGKYSEENEFADFMIDIEQEKAAMNALKDELEEDMKTKSKSKKEFDTVANQKASVEIQLNFLINQLIHYLSQIKK